jgi:hypothetical protein
MQATPYGGAAVTWALRLSRNLGYFSAPISREMEYYCCSDQGTEVKVIVKI